MACLCFATVMITVDVVHISATLKVDTVLTGAVVIYWACRNICNIIDFNIMYIVLIKHIFTVATVCLYHCCGFIRLDESML